MIQLRTVFVLIIFSTLISSCATKQSIIYFQDDIEKDSQNVSPSSSIHYENSTIHKHDILNLSVSALDMTSLSAFMTNNIQQRSVNQLLIEGFKVNENGNINVPLVGDVNVEGLTTREASLIIQQELSKSIINPIVNITYLNFRFTILGEVKSPGTFSVYDPKINILQAIGLAGDIKMTGRRDNIKLIREVDDKITTTIIDITKSDFITSDAYFLRKNDILYIEPNITTIVNSGYIGPLGSIATFVSLFLSVAVYSQSQ